jgi:hypothetical protein
MSPGRRRPVPWPNRTSNVWSPGVSSIVPIDGAFHALDRNDRRASIFRSTPSSKFSAKLQ